VRKETEFAPLPLNRLAFKSEERLDEVMRRSFESSRDLRLSRKVTLRSGKRVLLFLTQILLPFSKSI